MKLEQIGFYTLSDERAKNTNATSPMMRCEMILTEKCNFSCPYCRGHEHGTMSLEDAKKGLSLWIKDGLQNVRFSGGEPTLYKGLNELVAMAKEGGVKRIAISTNGSRPFHIYEKLVEDGANDFSISLDACCATFGDKMAGDKTGVWNKVVENIEKLSKLTYVTVGVVLNETNFNDTIDITKFAHTLGVSDIRLISAAQYNKLIEGTDAIPQEIIDAHPILKYRVERLKEGKNVRGISETDCNKCHLIKDDSIIAGNKHFPCVIHMREGGKAIGDVNENMRAERINWFETHNVYEDEICRNNCLDVCVAYNNKAEEYDVKKNN